jgi:ABC-type transport system involved in multi-copper enzyme maturation permease subunit
VGRAELIWWKIAGTIVVVIVIVVIAGIYVMSSMPANNRECLPKMNVSLSDFSIN